MNILKHKKIDKEIINPSQAPKGKNIFYKCKKCNEFIPSQPKDNIGCKCGNIFIDIDYFRLDVEDFQKFEAIEIRGN